MKRLFFTTATVLALYLSLFFPVAAHADGIPAPSGQKTIVFASSDAPSTDTDPSLAAPFGVGPMATGGDSLTLSVSMEAFSEPVDLYVGILIPGSDSISIVNDRGGLQSLGEGLVPWRKDVSQPVSETLFQSIPASGIPTGTYQLYLLTIPAGSAASSPDYYLWTTSFENRATGEGKYAYQFFLEYEINESNVLVCPGACATTVVPVVRLKIEGGFNIVNSQVSGTGSARVTYNAPCSIDSLGGGGASYSCSVTGSTPGTFAIDGYVTGTKSVTGYGFQPTVELTLTEETRVGLVATNTWVNPATGVPTVLPLTYHAGSFSALLEASGVYDTPFEVTTVVCDGWMTQTLESEVSRAFQGSITVSGATGSMRYFDGTGQLFFYESPFHIDGDVESYSTEVE
jgi:hypothetical protein